MSNRWTDEQYEAFLDNEDSRANAYLCEQDEEKENPE